MEPNELYQRCAQLLGAVPELTRPGPTERTDREWIARACALVEAGGHLMDTAAIRMHCDRFSLDRWAHSAAMIDLLHRTMARAELQLPASEQGAFVLAGNHFDALRAVATIVREAKRSVFVVDPYLDEKALFDYMPSVSEQVPIRMLADSSNANSNASLRTAVTRWSQQYAAVRPIEVRLTAPRQLHDRLIIVDDQAYVVTQSLKDLAARSPATLTRASAELSQLKVDAYEQLWVGANPI